MGIPWSLVNDLFIDCSGNESDDEKEYEELSNVDKPTNKCPPEYLPCVPGHSRCFSIHYLCLYDLNEFGHMTPCRNRGISAANCSSNIS